jgi:hypothetical protein
MPGFEPGATISYDVAVSLYIITLSSNFNRKIFIKKLGAGVKSFEKSASLSCYFPKSESFILTDLLKR